MPQTSLQTAKKPNEYIIYTYKVFDDERFGVNRWQKLNSFCGLDIALQEAENLFRGQDFQKIEVVKRSFDEVKQKYISETTKVFQRNSRAQAITALGSAAAGIATLTMLLTVLQ